ncbi:hypothetical protein HDU99_009570, partial [Rhizoclosmatium hyalinum]
MSTSEAKKLEALVALEQALVKVPLEQFKRAFKTSQKHVEKEWAALATSAQEHIAKIDLKNGNKTEALK